MLAATWPTSCLSMPETVILVGSGATIVMPSGGSTTTGCEKPSDSSRLEPFMAQR
jgi:hypothetical protein